MGSIFTADDKKVLEDKGITEDKVNEQLSYFKQGFPPLNIKEPASIESGILKLSKNEISEYVAHWNNYLNTDKQITKFVPASGAASRMFKDLFSFLEKKDSVPSTDFEKYFFTNIKDFAFFSELNQVCLKLYDKTVDELITDKKYAEVVKSLLGEEGLNYGKLPKGLLSFHRYAEGIRTAMEEHLVEGTMYAKDKDNNVNVHFTISPQHEELFKNLLDNVKDKLEKQLSVHFDISFSAQKPSTDTVAVDMDNDIFREEGKILFRPGGHGALIENLNDLQSDVVFVKNIDNVVPDSYKENEVLYKKMLAGVLVDTQAKVFNYLEKLRSTDCNQEDLAEIQQFVENDLCITTNQAFEKNQALLVKYLIEKLDRPIRVCGMVRNEGEPGGGPFIVENKDNCFSPQILEGSQIDDKASPAFKDKATHFNPVDLVCAIRNSKGEGFDLLKYVDKDTGFISTKSKNGKSLKALELPGLWNGAMSDWNTVFVEVPINTFNPVKTVNDLLRDEHQ